MVPLLGLGRVQVAALAVEVVAEAVVQALGPWQLRSR